MRDVRRGVWTVLIGAALGSAAPIRAQISATADLALGAVRYEGFLGSVAASLTPAIRYDSPSFSAAAQGSYLVYESGRTLVQGAGAAAWLSPTVGPVRAELSGLGGLSRYASAPVAGYGMARARLHTMRASHGAWLGAGLGQAYNTSVTVATSELGLGAWVTFPGIAITASATYGTAEDSVFVDVTAALRWISRALEVTAYGGVRPHSTASDAPPFGEVTARLALTRVVAVQVAAGYFPADLLRGAVGGRYLSAGVRVALLGGPSRVQAPDERLRSEVRLPFPLPPDAPELTLEPAPLGARALTLRAAGATRVEIAADFTDWQPVALHRTRPGVWELPARLAPGIYRINVRIDGGGWQVPRGATPQEDEFGGLVGLILVR